LRSGGATSVLIPAARKALADRADPSLVPVRSSALLPLTEMLADEYDNPAAIHIAIIRHVL
jgi:hypothetical protein